VKDLDCIELVELVTEYLEDALDSDAQHRVIEPLSRCDGCSTYLQQVKATMSALGRLAPDPLDSQIRQDLLAALRQTPD
jgi:hypothetical protein